jgi:hypothetical protein
MLIDNRESPGVEDAVLAHLGLPSGAGRGLFEAATYTCSHCNVVVVLELKRTRARGFCVGCGQQICDGCAFIRTRTLTCLSMDQRITELQELDAVKQTDPDPPLTLLHQETETTHG